MLNSNRIQVLEHSSAQGEVLSTHLAFFADLGRSIWGWEPREQLKNQSEVRYGDSKIYLEPKGAVSEMMANLFVNFDLADTKHFRKVWFHPKDGLKFRGLLGIHDFTKKRPLIIIRQGIHGGVDDFIAERFVAKIAYEELDANFLVLESLTSHGFLASNADISFGGIDEGLQTFFAINEMARTEFAKLVSSNHIVAISFGGSGAFVSALLDQYNHKKIKSVVELCPLINLEETIMKQERSGLKAFLTDLWNVKRLVAMFDHYPNEPDIQQWWKSFFDLTPRFTPALILRLNEDIKQPLLTVADMNRLYPKMKWPPGFAAHLQNSKSFFELNNFWPLYKGVQTPFMVYSTPKDPLVDNESNSERIFRGTQPGDFSSLHFQRLERSTHCGLSSVYRWDYIVKLFKDGLEL